ncbi:MAG: DUF4157 domain-containing protein, partial [Schleiferiaceae bacterium]|nr:DUF4157 domain-containing protein [Schleiferiaceae bacterium]
MQFAKLPSENKTTSNRNARFFKSGGSNKRSFFDVQPKLKIGAPNDPYEKEADRVADRVVSDKGGGLINAKNYSIQRKCNSCEEEEAVQAKQNTNGTTPSFNHNNFKNQLNSCSNEGSKMESSVQRKMSSKMGADFGKVRIHTGNNAQQMSTSINAKAFTHGHNIYFNQGQYNPSSKEGTRLLAHELTHVIQQNGGSKAIQRDLAIPLPNPNAATPELSDTQIQDAIEYNQRHMRNAEEIRVTRDVLGLSHDQPTIDTAFVNAVARYQARNFITADGKIGRVTSARLSREFTAERQHLDRDESRDLYRASRRMGTRAMGIRVNSPAVTDRTQGYGEFGVMWNIPDQEANGYVIQHVRFFGNVT